MNVYIDDNISYPRRNPVDTALGRVHTSIKAQESRLIHSRKIVTGTIEQMPDKTNPGLQGVFLPRLVVTVTLH